MQNLKIAKRLLDCVISGNGYLTVSQSDALLLVTCELVKPQSVNLVKDVPDRTSLNERLRNEYHRCGGNDGGKIPAIRLYRTETGDGLLEATEYVEELLGCAYTPPRY